MGDVRSLGGQVYEMRIDYGPGYRLYFLRQDDSILVFLYGATRTVSGATYRGLADWHKNGGREVAETFTIWDPVKYLRNL